MNIHTEFTDLIEKFKTEKTKIETYISENKPPFREHQDLLVEICKIDMAINLIQTNIDLLIKYSVIKK